MANIGAPALFATHFHELTDIQGPGGVANLHVETQLDEATGGWVGCGCAGMVGRKKATDTACMCSACLCMCVAARACIRACMHICMGMYCWRNRPMAGCNIASWRHAGSEGRGCWWCRGVLRLGPASHLQNVQHRQLCEWMDWQCNTSSKAGTGMKYWACCRRDHYCSSTM